MNERKLFQSITKREKVKNEKVQVNFEKNYKTFKFKSSKGITLIALVISIIVMLILAGVSLNATIGDNGIIIQAQNATYMQSIAVLEEWLNQRYMELYINSEEKYSTRIEYLLHDENSDIFYQAPTGYRYMWNSDGKQRYFMDKTKLPEELKKAIKGSENREYKDYLNLNDVYGITSDLKVYYKTSNTILGEEEDLRVNFDKIEFDKNTTIGKLFGGEDGASIKDLVRQDKITLDGSSITPEEAKEVISKSAYLVGATKLELINLNLDDLNGIENMPQLVELYIKNTNIADYNKIGFLKNLQLLNVQNTNDTEIKKMCIAMSNTDYNYLAKMYITGSKTSNRIFSNMNLLEKLTTTTKESIKELYLNDNDLRENVDISSFKNLEKLNIQANRYLVNLYGLENLKKLNSIYGLNCYNLTNIAMLGKENSLAYLDISYSKLENLNFLNNADNIITLRVNGLKLKDINSLENKHKLRDVYLTDNKDLKVVDALKNDENIKYLYLAGCDNLIAESLLGIKGIINNCTDYSLPNGYALMFTDSPILTFKNEKIKLSSFKTLKNNNIVESLSLKGIIWIDNNGKTIDTNISTQVAEINSVISEVIGTMTEIKHLQIKDLSYINNIDFVKNLSKLKELDLRGTSVTDISVLDNNCLELATLILDNSSIDLTTIQNCINRMYDKKMDNKFYTALQSNLMLCTMDLVNQLPKCLELKNLKMSMDWYGGKIGESITVDISNLNNLKKIEIDTGKFGFKVPKILEEFKTDHYYTGMKQMDFTECEYIEKYSIKNMNTEETTDVLNFNNCKIKNINIMYSFCEVLDFSKIDLSETQEISITNYVQRSSKQIKGLQNMQKLTKLCIEGLRELVKINEINEATNLTNVIVINNSLADIEFLKNCNNITNLNAKGNRIFDLKPLTNMIKLQSLSIENNKIKRYSTYIDENGISNVYDNLEILKSLNKNNMLKFVYLTNNLLTEDDVNSSKIKDLKWVVLQL